ncbi:MAG: zinc-dependent metalloprotease [Saprospiraceae bacterium]|nr:zinc-dependent metalloprotease [Saprospiraceae bacterium]
MNHKSLSIIALCCGLVIGVQAQVPNELGQPSSNGLWKDVREIALPKYGKETPLLPEKFRLLALDFEQMKSTLARTAKQKGIRVPLEIPFPDGTIQQFAVESDPVMHPELAAKFPDINSYSGFGLSDPLAKIYFAFSPVGLHAIVLSTGKNPVIVEPIQKGDAVHHMNYFDRDFQSQHEMMNCFTPDAPELHTAVNNRSTAAGDCQLRNYRLAIATSGEFTAANSTLADPTGVNNTMANINALVTVINGVFINELSIRLQLVANNNLLILTDPATDGFTNGNQNTMAAENQAVVDGIIGNANYDIARAFGTTATANSASGVALQLGNVCVNAIKANGATVMNPANPTIGGFATLEMHEIGHQFGARHTFNEATASTCGNAGQLDIISSFEPGSGSTIMSYAGTCAPNNVQGNRDRYFHAINLQEIGNYVTVDNGSTCPTITPITNNQPTVNAGANFTVPVSTPFRLTATSNDPDGDPLTFCWEQMDNQLILHPPASNVTMGPVFRTFPPAPTPTRYFPQLPVILGNTATSTWEVLPSVSRTMNFRVTVRDNAPAAGCTDEDDMVVTFDANAGPFRVTGIGPDDDCLFADDNTLITWDVANTTAAPINCANVDIWLSLDGGFTYPTLLAGSLPNSGSASVYVPATAITQLGRIMVICSDNIFLNVNQKDVVIDCPANITVTDNPASGTYQSRVYLETSGPVVVAPSTSARFFAGQEIVLKDGFWAQQGCDFIARIQTCNPCVSPKPESLADEKANPNVYFYEDETSLRNQSEVNFSTPEVAVSPNPFNHHLTINFELKESGRVQIQLIDFTGRLVQTVYQNNNQAAGPHSITVPTHHLPNGIYSCRLIAPFGQKQVSVVKVD